MNAIPGWFYLAILAAIFAALTAIFAKIGLEGVDADYATLIRTLVIVLLLGIYVTAMGKWVNPATLSKKSLLFLLLSGIAACASWLFYFRALKLGDAAKVAPVDKLSLVLVAIFASLFLNEKLAVKDWTGILLIVGGIILLGLKK
ncbi:MAG TPA: EamA family transporter [Methylophilaceae bacterium]|nr:EamA family transporter [Methylophilaceae bacterium]